MIALEKKLGKPSSAGSPGSASSRCAFPLESVGSANSANAGDPTLKQTGPKSAVDVV